LQLLEDGHFGSLDAKLFDDRPPFLGIGGLQRAERLRRWLLARENLPPEIGEPRARRTPSRAIVEAAAMRAIKPVTPDEAATVWRSIPNPSARRVAKALTQAGRRVHFSTVARWRGGEWPSSD
jgi:hypothetical protein